MMQPPILTFRAGALDREVVLLGTDRIGEIITHRGGQSEFSLQLGETIRKRQKATSAESARNIMAVLVNDTLQRFGCLERGREIDVTLEGVVGGICWRTVRASKPAAFSSTR